MSSNRISAIVIFLSLCAGALPFIWGTVLPWWVAPVPYRNVQIIEQWVDGDVMHHTSVFRKSGCQFAALVIEGFYLGVSRSLSYADREAPRGDRVAGWHTLRLNISNVGDIDSIEIRTRHRCPSVDVFGRPIMNENGSPLILPSGEPAVDPEGRQMFDGIPVPVMTQVDRVYARVDPSIEIRPSDGLARGAGNDLRD